jgi:hypothetical protein
LRPNGIKLSRLHQAVLYGAFLVLWVSGVSWYVLHDGLTWLGELPEDLSSPLPPVLLQIHGGAAMAALLVLGSLTPQHIKWAWTGKMNRGTGLLMLATQALLVVTGYALYYAGDEAMRNFASGLHLAIGAGFPLLLLWHILEGRRRAAMLRGVRRDAGRRPAFAAAPIRVELPGKLAPEAERSAGS